MQNYPKYLTVATQRRQVRGSHNQYNAEGAIASVPGLSQLLGLNHSCAQSQESQGNFQHWCLFQPVCLRNLQRILLPHPWSPSGACCEVTYQTWLPVPSLAQDWTIATQCSCHEVSWSEYRETSASTELSCSVVADTHECHHIKPVLAQLHWLPIRHSRSPVVVNIRRTHQPSHLSDMIKEYKRSRHFDPHLSCYLRNCCFKQWLIVVHFITWLPRLGTVFRKQPKR